MREIAYRKVMERKRRKRLDATIRYCLDCKKMRIFEFSLHEGHSRCTICGGGRASRQPC